MNKIKIVWICHLSDAKIRAYLKFSKLYFKTAIKKIFGMPPHKWTDYAVWNANAIKEFEKFNDVELTVVFPHQGIKGRSQNFSLNGVNYICFRSEDDNIISFIKNRFFKNTNNRYLKNRRFVIDVIKEIKPDIVHIIGAENPYYSIAALDVPNEIPCIISLQTLMSDPDFFSNYPISKNEYLYRSGIEAEVIKKCDYICTTVVKFRDIIKKILKPNAVFLDVSLAVGVDIDDSEYKKEYDFVYFAGNINKAADHAIEAFALALKSNPRITLNISGYYSDDYKLFLDNRIKELNIENNVIFTGEKESHDEVLRQIKKSKFALLPLKIDLISGTIREAMACGLPVVTTRTPGTPVLNEKRESVLISDIGDYQGMADNMIRLIEDEQYAIQIKKNGFQTIRERYQNYKIMCDLKNVYYTILSTK